MRLEVHRIEYVHCMMLAAGHRSSILARLMASVLFQVCDVSEPVHGQITKHGHGPMNGDTLFIAL